MLIIQNQSQLNTITDPDIRKLVTLRLTQLDSTLPTPMIIVESGDTLSSIDKEIGFSILTNLFDDVRYPDPDFAPCFEVLEDQGTFYEMLFIFGDGDEAVEICNGQVKQDTLLSRLFIKFPLILNRGLIA